MNDEQVAVTEAALGEVLAEVLEQRDAVVMLDPAKYHWGDGPSAESIAKSMFAKLQRQARR